MSTAASALPAFLRSFDLPEPGELRRVARVYVWGRWFVWSLATFAWLYPLNVDEVAYAPNEQSLTTRRGRPYGSGIFEDGQAFLQEIRLAVAQVHVRGSRVTQERVAEVMSQRGLMGSSGADRQLRFWVKEFSFAGWKDLLRSL